MPVLLGFTAFCSAEDGDLFGGALADRHVPA
jgi:hypothetical protein